MLEIVSPYQYILIAFYALAAFTTLAIPFEFIGIMLPLVAYIHRFNLSFSLFGLQKTISLMVFLVPFFLFRALWWYVKNLGIKKLLKDKVIWIIIGLFLVDSINVVISIDSLASLVGLGAKVLNYSAFVTGYIWLKMLLDLKLEKRIKLIRYFIISFLFILVVNSLISVHQFLDCSIFHRKCIVWRDIDQLLPNNLLAVGHQKFFYRPTVIRTPGLFGDVNMNGTFTLLGVILLEILVVYEWIQHRFKRKKYLVAYLLITVVALITYVLTLSRSALLGFGVMNLLLLIYIFGPVIKKTNFIGYLKERWVKIAIIAVLIISVVGVSGYALSGIEFRVKNYRTLGQIVEYYFTNKFLTIFSDNSALGHVDYFKEGFEMFKQSKMLGWGIDTFSTVYTEIIDSERLGADPHSTYVMVLVEQGLVGILAYLIFFIYLWWNLIKYLRLLKQSLLNWPKGKKIGSRQSRVLLISLVLLLFILAIPYYTIATLTYYGFFLPMTWWWGTIDIKGKEKIFKF